MKTSAIVVHHNGPAIDDVVAAIAPQVERVMVICNGDHTPAPPPDGFVVRVDENLGFGHAANFAAAAAPGEVLIILNDDCIVDPGCVDALVAELAADPTVGIVGPVLRDRDGTSTWGGGTFDRLTWRPNQHVGVASGEPYNVDWLDGACVAIRRAAFRDARGYDERYFLYYEDVDLALRLAALGWRARVVPRASASHTVSGGFLAPSSRTERNWLLLVKNTAPPRVRLRSYLWQLYALCRGSFRRTDLTRARWAGTLRFVRGDWYA